MAGHSLVDGINSGVFFNWDIRLVVYFCAVSDCLFVSRLEFYHKYTHMCTFLDQGLNNKLVTETKGSRAFKNPTCTSLDQGPMVNKARLCKRTEGSITKQKSRTPTLEIPWKTENTLNRTGFRCM